MKKCLPLPDVCTTLNGMICRLFVFVMTVENSEKLNGSVAERYYDCMCPKNAVIGEE